MCSANDSNKEYSKLSQGVLLDFAVETITKNLESDNIIWIIKDSFYKSVADLLFVYKNTLYSVLLDVYNEDNKSLLADDSMKNQISCAKESNFIACTFPIIVDNNKKLKTKNANWNLYKTETNELIDFNEVSDLNKSKISDWVLEVLGINYIRDDLISKGCEIVSIQNIHHYKPQIIYNDKNGNKSYVIVQIQNLEDYSLYDEEIISEIIDDYKNYEGYEATLSVNLEQNSKEIYFGDEIGIKTDYYIRINTAAVEVSPKNPIENENIYNLIKETIKSENISDKKYSRIYYLNNYEEYVLKTKSPIISNIDIITKDLVIIPYKYDQSVKENPHYGLPLYYVTGRRSKYANQTQIDPQDKDILNKTNMNILKRVFGQNITKEYRYLFFLLYGEFSDKSYSLEIKKVLDIRQKYGNSNAGNVINWLNSGIYSVSQNQLRKGSEPYNFKQSKDFSILYSSFVTSYLNSLKKLSMFPQKSYNDVIKCIREPKNFIFDFSLPSNIIVDYNTECFNFINFIFDKEIVNNVDYNLQIEQFFDSILGCYENVLFEPYDILFRESDMELFNQYKTIISDKIEKARIST